MFLINNLIDVKIKSIVRKVTFIKFYLQENVSILDRRM